MTHPDGAPGAAASAANPLSFAGAHVLVVGGSSGIGNGIARAFLAAGAQVTVWGTRASAADYSTDTGSDLSGLAYAQVDVGNDDAVVSAAANLPKLDVLILSQGIVLYRRGEYEMPGFRKVLDVNLMSVMACAQAFHEKLKAARGSVIVISSTAAFHATRGNPGYAASKAGAVGLVRTLADAWASDGIRVNGIAPGFVATKMTEVTTKNPQRLDAALQRIPVGRLGTPQDMAGVALFLASPLSAYVVGHTIPVDGGLLLN
jgi:3-oxoacyl-[acyl-carrier protein] reductase